MEKYLYLCIVVGPFWTVCLQPLSRNSLSLWYLEALCYVLGLREDILIIGVF